MDEENIKQSSQPFSEPRAKEIFEQRNRAFRILYDTVLDIAAAGKEQVVAILCQNLREMTGAVSAVLATFDGGKHTLTLEAVAGKGCEITIPDADDPANRAVMSDELVDIYKYTRLRKCIREEMCFDRIFPDCAVLRDKTCYGTNKCYSFSCVFENELLACGLLEFEQDQPFKMKDMVDTYLSMAGMILQRANAVRELEQSKRRFKALIENCPVGIAVISRAKRIVEINSLALGMLGRGREDILGKCCKEIFCIEEEREECPYWNKTYGIRQEEKCLKVDAQTKVPIITTVYPVEIEGEDYVIETFVDITERKKQEEARLRLEKQLYQAQKLEGLGTLAAGIAHEINTPVQFINDNMRFIEESFSGIIGGMRKFRDFLNDDSRVDMSVPDARKAMEEMLAMAEFSYLCEELPKALRETKEGLSRVADIVRAMKDFSHIDSNERASADLNKSVVSAVMITQNSWKYVADVSTELDDGLPDVPCFINDINQAVMNLIINAVHTIEDARAKCAGAPRKGRILIKTFRTGDGYAGISVSDTGTGIPENIRDKIFEPFFTTKPVGKGTGQGLSMAYASIVEKHFGRVRFDTEMGKGTTFFIEIPLRPAQT